MSRLPLLALAPLALAPLSALAAPPAVVTDIPPVHALVADVMGDLGTPTLLLDRGANAHDYQMRPADARALQDADLVFWMGARMTPWLDRALNGLAADTRAMALLESETTFRRDFGDASAHDHGDHKDHDATGHEAGDHAAGDHDDHAHDGLDPHAWLDPANARAWLAVIAAELSAADPENATRYSANAEAAGARIAALDARLAAGLAPVRDTPFIVFHDAYGYFAGHYGLNVAGSVNLGDATAPGARHLADLRDRLGAQGVRCAFPEAQHDPKQLAIVIEGTDVRLGGTLDPAGSLLDPGPALYDRLLAGMAQTLLDCLAQN